MSVPSVFIGNAGLEGESSIRKNIEPLVAWYEEKNQGNGTTRSEESGLKTGIKAHRTVISIPLVLLAGIIDGINPCACAVVIFLLIFLMTIRQRLRILLAGAVFSSAVFFFYFLSGIGLITFSKHSGFVYGSSVIVGILAIIAGILIIAKALFPNAGPKLISDSMQETVVRNIENLTVPIAFILGFILGIFELPCTGGIYIAILDMISFKVNMEQGLVYLFLYNLAFIIPLIIITCLVHWGINPGRVEEQKPEQRRGFQIFTGLLLFVFAFLILTGIM